MTTLGKYRRLTRCSNEAGQFNILACDHRGNLRGRMTQDGQPIDDDGFRDFKQELLQTLLPEATAVLADPEFGFGPGFAERNIPGQVGTLSPLEVTDYGAPPDEQGFTPIAGWGVAKCARAGVDGVKLLLPYHREAKSAPAKREWVAQVVAECAAQDIPFFLEPIAYSMGAGERLTNVELRGAIVGIAAEFSALGVDVLKLQFPVDAAQSDDEDEWRAACAEVDAACAVPWALLSAGVDYATFARQARVACEAGASGVIVGRAVWAEAVPLTGAERGDFLRGEGRARMAELAGICAKYARPWMERVAPPEIRGRWYETYEAR